jgi:hypothetical protein
LLFQSEQIRLQPVIDRAVFPSRVPAVHRHRRALAGMPPASIVSQRWPPDFPLPWLAPERRLRLLQLSYGMDVGATAPRGRSPVTLMRRMSKFWRTHELTRLARVIRCHVRPVMAHTGSRKIWVAFMRRSECVPNGLGPTQRRRSTQKRRAHVGRVVMPRSALRRPVNKDSRRRLWATSALQHDPRCRGCVRPAARSRQRHLTIARNIPA